MKKLIVALALCTFGSAQAQQYMTTLTWSVGFAMSDFQDYIEEPAFRGFAIDGRKFFSPHFSGGLSFAWNGFDEKTGEVIQLENGGALSGTQVRIVNTFPILLSGYYSLSPRSLNELMLYIGLGAGFTGFTQRLEVNVYAFQISNWHFTLAPEVGLVLPFQDVAFTLRGKYLYGFDAGETLGGRDDNSWEYLTVDVGFAFYH